MKDIFNNVMARFQRFFRACKINSLDYQKVHWEEELKKYDWNAERLYGYDWGDPEASNDRLGNYLEVKNRVLSYITPDTTILEIGSLGGKWVQYFINAGNVICVDINESGFKYIKNKLPYQNITFYLTKGYELEGIPDSSVDIVFSMDTLVRVSKKYIYSYIMESMRVLKSHGRLFLHLPCREIKMSRDKMFVDMTEHEIVSFCRRNNFKDINVDKQVIKHGVILEAIKE